MGVNIETLSEVQKTTTLLYGKEWKDREPVGVVVTYRPEALSVDDMDDIVANGATDILETTVNFITKVVVAWNLEDSKGPIPVDAEGVGRVGQKLTDWLMIELIKDARPNAQTPTQSQTGLSRAERRRMRVAKN